MKNKLLLYASGNPEGDLIIHLTNIKKIASLPRVLRMKTKKDGK